MKYKHFNNEYRKVGLYFGVAFNHYLLWEVEWFSVWHCFCLFPTLHIDSN